MAIDFLLNCLSVKMETKEYIDQFIKGLENIDNYFIRIIRRTPALNYVKNSITTHSFD